MIRVISFSLFEKGTDKIGVGFSEYLLGWYHSLAPGFYGNPTVARSGETATFMEEFKL
jgi:hypothetical protein